MNRLSRAALETIVKAIPTGIVVIEKDTGKITYVNKHAIQLYGVDPTGLELPGHSTKLMKLLTLNGDIYPSELLPASRALLYGEDAKDELIIERPNGSRIVVFASATPIRDENNNVMAAVSIFEDITERKQTHLRLEAYTLHLQKLVDERTHQLQEKERLAAIGQTASMVGHDIRNPLQSIVSELYLARQEIEDIPSDNTKNALKESMQLIEEQTFYINKIVADLQDYTKPLTPKPQLTKLDAIVKESLSSIMIPDNISVSLNLQENASEITIDPLFLKRVLINLMSNGLQAMPNGGKLSVNTEFSDKQVTITVKDTGTGIPENVKHQIFQPLFTTKAKGQGLGLAVVKRLTDALKGTVYFESELGKGTAFVVKLPLDTEKAA